MKLALSLLIATAALSLPALAQSTTAKVPTGYEVKGATDYRLINGPNWSVKHIVDKCSASELGKSDSKCVTVGTHSSSEAAAGAAK